MTCVVSATLVLVSAGRVWLRFLSSDALGSSVRGDANGHQVAAVAVALGIVVLAGPVALPATRGGGRLGVALLLALAGAGIVADVASVLASPTSAVGQRAAAASRSAHPHVTQLQVTAWPYVCLAGGVVALAVGAFVFVRGRRWPAMGRRYDPVTAGGRPAAADRRPAAPADDGSSMWDSLDRGEDPTA